MERGPEAAGILDVHRVPTVEVDDAIPPEHYKAVAEVIGYVMKLRKAAGGR